MNFFSFWWQPFLCTRGIAARVPMERLQRWTKASSSCWKPSNATWQGMSFFGDLPNGLFYIDFPAEKPSQQTIVKSRESALFCVIFWLHWSEQYWFLFCFGFLTSRWRFMMRTEIALWRTQVRQQALLSQGTCQLLYTEAGLLTPRQS